MPIGPRTIQNRPEYIQWGDSQGQLVPTLYRCLHVSWIQRDRDKIDSLRPKHGLRQNLTSPSITFSAQRWDSTYVPIIKPVPIAPPIAIIVTWRAPRPRCVKSLSPSKSPRSMIAGPWNEACCPFSCDDESSGYLWMSAIFKTLTVRGSRVYSNNVQNHNGKCDLLIRALTVRAVLPYLLESLEELGSQLAIVSLRIIKMTFGSAKVPSGSQGRLADLELLIHLPRLSEGLDENDCMMAQYDRIETDEKHVLSISIAALSSVWLRDLCQTLRAKSAWKQPSFYSTNPSGARTVMGAWKYLGATTLTRRSPTATRTRKADFQAAAILVLWMSALQQDSRCLELDNKRNKKRLKNFIIAQLLSSKQSSFDQPECD